MQHHLSTAPNAAHSNLMGMQKNRKQATQAGVTLVELMVGIAVGLLVVAVAMGALMASRGISGTVSEATNLQQQAAYAFRIIGQQIRQGGSLELGLNPSIVLTPASDTNPAMVPVAFDPPDPTGVRPPFNRASSTLSGETAPPSLTVGYQNYTEVTTAGATPVSLLRDCLGQNKVTAGIPDNAVIASTFKRSSDPAKNELVCTGTGGDSGEQALIDNVTDIQIRYIEQTAGGSTMSYVSSPSAGNTVYAVEVCLELTGTENIPTTTEKYTDCSGTQKSYGDKLRMVFRNVFQIRSQGQV